MDTMMDITRRLRIGSGPLPRTAHTAASLSSRNTILTRLVAAPELKQFDNGVCDDARRHHDENGLHGLASLIAEKFGKARPFRRAELSFVRLRLRSNKAVRRRLLPAQPQPGIVQRPKPDSICAFIQTGSLSGAFVGAARLCRTLGWPSQLLPRRCAHESDPSM